MKKDNQKTKRRSNPKIVITALTALIFTALAFTVSPYFIIIAIILWWMNKKFIKKHFG
jgi:hypothetical protein